MKPTSNPQEMLVTFLKKKGTGQTMGKHLSEDECLMLDALFRSTETHMVTKATLLTAMLTLTPNEYEAEWINRVRENPSAIIPDPLIALLPSIPSEDKFIQLIHNVINHIDLEEMACLEALEYIFNPKVPDYYKAAFLEAERLKRESDIENVTCLLDFVNRSSRHRLDLPLLIDLAYPYDGFNRTPNLSPFLAALLSSIGIRVILHGIKDIGPKYGITPLKIITAQNPNFNLTLPDIITRIQNDQCGWSYIDQSATFPSLYHLKDCRKYMVKRPIISTIEKLLCPIYSNYNHIIVTGFTHPPYRQKMIHLFKHHPLIKTGIIIRGMEGSPQLPLDRRSPFILVNDQNSTESFMCPTTFNIPRSSDSFPANLTAEETLKIGINALKGEKGWARDQLIYQALAITDALSIKRTDDALSALCLSIETGMAYFHWKIGTE